jgi:hypothetical protein|tara:strand:- start:78 stop:251 length:174 start_codon:yes stop_codon:yes gene_type:complete
MAKKKKSLLKLTARQEETMKRHSKHHTPKHMKTMKTAMLKGSTFGAAHKLAQKKVGT